MTERTGRIIASTQDVPLGKTHCVDVDGQEILICHTREGIYAVDNICSHAEARLSEGKLKGTRILCPLHGAAFDVRDGKALSKPASRALAIYPLQLDGDDILLTS